MANKYLDNNGLLYLWSKIKSKFVAQETGKSLTTNDFTNDYKTKLDGLSNYTLPTATADTLGGIKVGTNLTITNGVLSADAGGITIDSSLSTTSTNPVQNSVITNALNNKASTSIATTSTNGLMSSADKTKLNSLSSVMTYKGTVANYTDLPTNANIGDTYNITNSSDYNKAGDNAVWNGTAWDILSGTIDLSAYMLQTDMVAITNAEIDTIVAS